MNEHMRYLGVLKLLEECSPFVDEDTRVSIKQAFVDACEAIPDLRFTRILNRLQIDVV